MSDKLETFIEERIKEFDTIELPEDLLSKIDTQVANKSLSSVKSNLLSKFIYFGLSILVIVATTIYFVSQRSNDPVSITSNSKQKEIAKDGGVVIDDTKQNSEQKSNQDLTILPEAISHKAIEKKEPELAVSTTSEEIILPKQDSLKVKIKDVSKLVDIAGVERGIFYHISYSGGPSSGIKSQFLFWFTHQQLPPNTHFIIEHYCWNRWVRKAKVTGKGRPGTGDYSGKEPGKFQYKFGKIPPHSGENKWRVLFMNDSNICLGVSKELYGIDSKGEPLAFVPKVDHTNKKKDKEIVFSAETYYELYDALGTIVDKGFGKTLSYAILEKGIYTLYYDNTSTTFKNK